MAISHPGMPSAAADGGAKTRFLSIFPAGFADPGYARHERDYKDKARAKLLATLSINGSDPSAHALRTRDPSGGDVPPDDTL